MNKLLIALTAGLLTTAAFAAQSDTPADPGIRTEGGTSSMSTTEPGPGTPVKKHRMMKHHAAKTANSASTAAGAGNNSASSVKGE